MCNPCWYWRCHTTQSIKWSNQFIFSTHWCYILYYWHMLRQSDTRPAFKKIFYELHCIRQALALMRQFNPLLAKFTTLFCNFFALLAQFIAFPLKI